MTKFLCMISIFTILFMALFPICIHLAIDSNHPIIIDSSYVKEAENTANKWCYTVLDKDACSRINNIMNNAEYKNIDIYCGIFCGQNCLGECKSVWHHKYEIAQYYYIFNCSISMVIIGLAFLCIIGYNTEEIQAYQPIPDKPLDSYLDTSLDTDIDVLP